MLLSEQSPTNDTRKSQIELNKQLFTDLSNPQFEGKYNGWQIVALFYAAVHCIELVLIEKTGQPTGDHGTRGARMKSYPQYFSAVFRSYFRLYEQSRCARYLCMQYTPTEVNELHDELNNIENNLAKYID